MSFWEEYHKIVARCLDKKRMDEMASLQKRLSEREVVLFGAAWIGDFIYEKLRGMGITPVCFADNYVTGVTPGGNGPILRPQKVKEKYPDAVIILSLDRAKEIVYRQLLEIGFKDKQIIKESRLLLATMDLKSFAPHEKGYAWAYDFFEDDISKKIILQRIACYLLGEGVDKSTSPQYFEEGLLSFSEEEVFADGGFFTGDTAEEFIRQTGGKYRKIYGFEPDSYVRDKMSASLKGEAIEIVPAGLYEKNGVVRFASTEGHSAASGGNVLEDECAAENVIEIPVVSLDEFFADKPTELQPTFIKMDIEGSEKKALLGAEKTIRRYRPKLAICVYHKPEDIYELTELIQSFCPEYKFVLRHYTNYFWETVLYAYERLC